VSLQRPGTLFFVCIRDLAPSYGPAVVSLSCRAASCSVIRLHDESFSLASSGAEGLALSCFCLPVDLVEI